MDKKTKDELLLYLIGMGSHEIELPWLAQLSDSDWDDLIEQSRRHSVAPLLYYRLKTDGAIAHVPTRVMQTLQKTYLYHA